jgi:putative glycerol-1-phosphate prenyltransferase
MHKLLNQISSGKKQFAVLIDPDKNQDDQKLLVLLNKISALNPTFIFVGGSTVDSNCFNQCIELIKENCTIPLIIFPGSQDQIHPKADGILFLSLISGRNPDYLIGHHIESAHRLKKMDIEVIPTGYLLIDGGKNSSVQYVSQTTPIPSDQYSIAVKTAIAGELLGMQAIFLDAGSGAINAVNPKMIEEVKRNIKIPLIIGGGLKTINQVKSAFESGADLVVIGNKIEEDVDFLLDLMKLENTRFNI